MKLLLTAINAKYIHSSLAIRYLNKNCQNLACSIEMLEVSINNHLLEIANQIFDARPDVLGLSCYIWNIELVKQLLPLVHKLLPECKIICGGPEVSYETKEFMQEFSMVDYVVRGESEEAFHELMQALIEGKSNEDIKIKGVAKRNLDNTIDENVAVTVADLDTIKFPYDDEDIESLKDKIIYYESSRGCPYSCKYCLSCATRGVRYRSLDKVFAELSYFIRHNVRQVKFVDRTFNADKKHYLPILEFIAKQECRTNFHFEIVAHHIDDEIKEVLKNMPKGRVQFEIGIQSTNIKTLGKISRANPWEEMTNNIKSIMAYGNIHLHVDLIIGLPYEDITSFAKSFNDVYLLQADMLQVGFLKLLKGAAMNDLIEEHNYVYMPQAPYQVISNKYMDYTTMRKLQIFVDVVEMYYNAGRFRYTITNLIAKYQQDAYTFFFDLATYWQENKLHLAPHAPKNLYVFLYDFIAQNERITDKEYIYNVLKLDALLSDKGKIKPEMLPWQEIEKQATDEFYMSEQALNYIKDYKFKSWRDLKKKFFIEIFAYDMNKAKENEIVVKKNAMIFTYDDKMSEVVYQEIKQGDINL